MIDWQVHLISASLYVSFIAKIFPTNQFLHFMARVMIKFDTDFCSVISSPPDLEADMHTRSLRLKV